MSSAAFGIILPLLFTFNFQAADSSTVYPNKAQKAEVVLRVKLLSSGEGSKYLWDQVEVLQVVKNKSGYAFRKDLSGAHYSWKPGYHAQSILSDITRNIIICGSCLTGRETMASVIVVP